MSTPLGSYIATQLPAPAFGVALRRFDVGVPDVQPGEQAFADYPTPAQLTAAGFVLSKTLNTMQGVATQIFSLTTGQQNNIITALFGGSPPLYFSDSGPNASAISACYVSVVNSSGVAVFNRYQQLIMAAIYTLDNPGWLITPSFDPSINVSGYLA